MASLLQIPSHQTFLEVAQKPENINFPNVNYGTLNSDASRNPKQLKLKTPRPIWRPYKVTFSNFDIKISKCGENPVKKKKRKKVIIPSHILVTRDEKSQKELYHCTVCKKTFKTKAHVKYHRFCSGGKKPFKCKDCEMEFVAKSHFEYHLRTHTGELPYACATCNKRFNQQGKLTRHMKIHTGEKPFICECGKGFSNSQALNQHNLVHTGERPFPCLEPGCSKRFTNRTNLKKHKVTHTGERLFSCKQCSKSYGVKWSLEIHKKTHESDRAHACDVCERAFLIKKDLLRHSINHSDKRPHGCEFCKAAFHRKDNLIRHIRTVHRENKIRKNARKNKVLPTAVKIVREEKLETFLRVAKPKEKVTSELEEGPELALPDVNDSDHDRRQVWRKRPAAASTANVDTFDSNYEVIDLTLS